MSGRYDHLAARPVPGTPRPYEFPGFERGRLSNGIEVRTVHLPGRPLVSAALVLRTGAGDEPAEEAGATVLAARALPEGTERYDAVALVEATERLGAELHADAGWDSTAVGVDVPVARLAQALELLAEVVERPTFPDREVERLRAQRLNDLLQAMADPGRRAEDAFAERVYAAEAAYARPAGGRRPTVERLDSAVLRRTYQTVLDPARTAIVVGGDLGGVDVAGLLEPLFGDWSSAVGTHQRGNLVDRPATEGPRLRLVHRAGSVQTEIRVGHVGLPRRIPDFHAVQVMATILGGLFNSRLNRKLREEKGYTYGAGAGFDMRRAAGPFVARTAVNTEATAAALADLLAELRRIRDERVADDELRAARDYLIGVFPLRFETPGPVVSAITGLFVQGLPDDELANYRAAIEAVGIDDVRTAAERHIDPDQLAVVLVGDADVVGPELAAAGHADIEIVRDEGSAGDVPEVLGEDADDSGS